MYTQKNILIIAGPTASGKSSLALRLAQEIGGVVINADSMQLYAPYPILTAQPPAAEKAQAPHTLYGIMHPPAHSSAAAWRSDAIGAMNGAFENNLIPMIVGGTGLYLESLMHGLSAIPDVNEAYREEARATHTALGGAAFRKQLFQYDPVLAAKLHDGDTQRLIRAYEVYLATGTPLSVWQEHKPVAPPPDWRFKTILLEPTRDALNKQITNRFEKMLKHGAVEEVKAARHLAIPDNHPAQKAIGRRELADFLEGKTDLAIATTLAQTATRHYAKRQTTWFKNRFLKKEQEAGRDTLILENANGADVKAVLQHLMFR